MICPKCHTLNDDEEKFCRNCGFQLSSSRICPECGKTNDSNSKYCKECGTVLTPVNTFRKQIIEENTKQSFFSMYKVPIICALLIILAIGGVAGMAFYNGNSGGDDGWNTFIPSDNSSGILSDTSEEPTQAKMEENATNLTANKTNDTNASKTLTEKIENKTKQANDTVNKVKDSSNSSKASNSKNDSSKTLTEKVKTDDKNSKNDSSSTNKNPIASDENSDKNTNPFSGLMNLNNSEDDSEDEDINDSADDSDIISDTVDDSNSNIDSADDSDGNNDDSDDSNTISDTADDSETNAEDELDDEDEGDSISEIEMTDVPNLAQKVSGTGYSFSTIEYNGNEYTKAQCIYIFSEYILNADKGKTSAIEFKDFKEAPSPSGEDLSQSVEKSDYLSIADRVHSWMDSEGSAPNYVGITQRGVADLSPNKMLKLFTLVTLSYAVSEDLPASVDI